MKLLGLNGHRGHLAHKRALGFRQSSRTAKIIGEGKGDVLVPPRLRAPTINGCNELRPVRDPASLPRWALSESVTIEHETPQVLSLRCPIISLLHRARKTLSCYRLISLGYMLAFHSSDAMIAHDCQSRVISSVEKIERGLRCCGHRPSALSRKSLVSSTVRSSATAFGLPL